MVDDSKIMLRRPGEEWRQPHVGAYDNEAALQSILVETPNLIPGVGNAVAVEELYLPAGGSVDVTVVSAEGEITLVECKLAANSEVRRAVVSQILSYASAAWRMTYEEFDERFRQRTGQSLLERVSRLSEEVPEWEAEDFRQAVAEALDQGNFRLVVAVDRITDELKGIIEYLNTHTVSHVEVLALELGYVADEGVEILLPRSHGQESARVRGPGRSDQKPSWKVDDVFTELSNLCSDVEVQAVRRLYEHVIKRGGKVYPGRGAYPTMSAYLTFDGDSRAVWAVYADPSGPSAPRISLNFGSWLKSLSLEQLESILTQLESVDALVPQLSKVRDADFNLYPTIPLSTLAVEGAPDAIIDALDPFTAAM